MRRIKEITIEEIAKEAGIEYKEIEEAKYFHSQVKKILSQIPIPYDRLNYFFCYCLFHHHNPY